MKSGKTDFHALAAEVAQCRIEIREQSAIANNRALPLKDRLKAARIANAYKDRLLQLGELL